MAAIKRRLAKLESKLYTDDDMCLVCLPGDYEAWQRGHKPTDDRQARAFRSFTSHKRLKCKLPIIVLDR